MTKAIAGLTVAAGALALSVAIAHATHNVPKDAKKIVGVFVKAVAECVPPSADTSTSNGFPACSGVVYPDPTCTFGSYGKGKYLARYNALGPDRISGTTDDGDMDLQVSLVGLEGPSCPGQTLTLAMTWRIASDDCGGNPCTVYDIDPLNLTTCTVDSTGKCKLKTTVNTALPGVLLNGIRNSIIIKTVSLLNGADPSFESGILIK